MKPTRDPIRACLLIAAALAEGPRSGPDLEAAAGLSRAQRFRVLARLKTPPPEGFGMRIEQHPGEIYAAVEWGILNPEALQDSEPIISNLAPSINIFG
jgi:hypothetical protein